MAHDAFALERGMINIGFSRTPDRVSDTPGFFSEHSLESRDI